MWFVCLWLISNVQMAAIYLTFICGNGTTGNFMNMLKNTSAKKYFL